MSAPIKDYLELFEKLLYRFQTIPKKTLYTAIAGNIIQDERGDDDFFSCGDVDFVLKEMGEDIQKRNLVQIMDNLARYGIFRKLEEDKYQFNRSYIKPRKFKLRSPEYFSEKNMKKEAITEIIKSSEEALISTQIRLAFERKYNRKWDSQCDRLLKKFPNVATVEQLLSEAKIDVGSIYIPRLGLRNKLYWYEISQLEKWKKRIIEKAHRMRY